MAIQYWGTGIVLILLNKGLELIWPSLQTTGKGLELIWNLILHLIQIMMFGKGCLIKSKQKAGIHLYSMADIQLLLHELEHAKPSLGTNLSKDTELNKYDLKGLQNPWKVNFKGYVVHCAISQCRSRKEVGIHRYSTL
jgi:hypothetical protein